MKPVFEEDPPLPYPTLKHHTRWPGTPLSEEYLIPPEDKPALLEQLYPFVETPALDERLFDIHEKREFVVRDFKVVREGGMNMLVSPYYYRSGGSVIDWMPIESADSDPDQGDEEENDDNDPFDLSMSAQQLKPDATARMIGLIERQHEGPGC